MKKNLIIISVIVSALITIFSNQLAIIGDVITNFILTTSTLGIDVFQNSIYIEISKGYYENVSLFISSLLVGIFVGLIVAMTIDIISNKKNLKTKNNSKKVRFFKILLIIYSIFVVIYLPVSLARHNYINNAIAHFTKLITIVEPYISESEIKKIKSKFAQISNKNDFKEIINQLDQVTEDKINKKYKFNIW